MAKYKSNYLFGRIAYKGNKAKTFWVKMKGSDTWKILISADTDLSFSIVVKYK